MSADLIMYDTIDIAQIPMGPAAVAGYVDGAWPTMAELVERHPNAHHMSIAVSAAHDADCLDVETGDATPADVPGWYDRQRAGGAERPCLYANASAMQAWIIPLVRSGRIPRASVRLWSAHYAGLHICAPSTCGAVSIAMDGTQWTSKAWGRNLDESALLAGFFGGPVTKPPAVPAWQETMMDALPELSEGADDSRLPHWYVRRVQAIASAIFGAELRPDGAFGPATKAAVEDVQRHSGIPVTGKLDPATWEVLLAP